jgi:hypothetical protein
LLLKVRAYSRYHELSQEFKIRRLIVYIIIVPMRVVESIIYTKQRSSIKVYSAIYLLFSITKLQGPVSAHLPLNLYLYGNRDQHNFIFLFLQTSSTNRQCRPQPQTCPNQWENRPYKVQYTPFLYQVYNLCAIVLRCRYNLIFRTRR